MTFTTTQKRFTIDCWVLYHIGISGGGIGFGFGGLTFTTRGNNMLRH